MAIFDEIVTYYKLLGIEEAERKIQEVRQLMVAFGETDLSKLLKQISEYPEKLKSIGQTASQAQSNIKAFSSASQKLSTAKGLKPGELEVQAQIEILPEAISKAKKEAEAAYKANPASLFTKIDINNLQSSVLRAQKEINKIQKFGTKSAAIGELVKQIDTEVAKKQKSLKIDKQKVDLAERYKQILNSIGANVGLERLGKSKQPEVAARAADIQKNIEANKQNANAIAETARQRIKDRNHTNAQNKAQERLNESIRIAIGKLIRYRVAFYTMRGAIRGIEESIRSFIDLQYQLADLEKVIDRQTDSIKEYREEAFALAQTFGNSVSDIVDSFRVWAQTGLSQQEVLEATRATLIGVNALGENAKKVTEALTAVIFTYGVAAENVTNILSKWLSVQREFPISASDLANSLKVVGASAQVVGIDLDDLAGYVAAIGAATRKSGKAVGQSLKTIFARLPKANTIQAFEALDIAVLGSVNELRDMDDVLDDLSARWDGLSTVQKANLATTLGGIRRYSDFIALMDNYEVKLAATIKAQRATTEAQEASELSLSTLKKELDSLLAVVEEYGVLFGQQLAGPIEFFTTTLKGFSEVIGPLKGPLTTIAGVAGIVGTAIAGITIAMAGASYMGSFLKARVDSLIVAMGVQEVQTDSLSASLALLQKQAGGASKAMGVLRGVFSSWGTAAIGVIGGVLTIISLIGLFANKQKEASDAVITLNEVTVEGVKKSRSRVKAIKEEIAQYDRLKVKIRGTAESIVDQGGFAFANSDDVERFHTLLGLLPDTSSDVQRGIATLNDAMRENRVETDELNKSLDAYNESLKERSKFLERDVIARINEDLDRAVNKAELYDKLIKGLGGNISVTIPKLDSLLTEPDIAGPQFSDKIRNQVKNAIEKGLAFAPIDFDPIKTVVDVTLGGIGVKRISGVMAESIEPLSDALQRAFEEGGLQKAQEKFEEALYKQRWVILYNYDQVKKTVEKLNLEDEISLDEDAIKENLSEFEKAWNRAVLSYEDNINRIEDINTRTEFETFSSLLTEELGQDINKFNRQTSAIGQFVSQYVKANDDMAEAQKKRNDLLEEEGKEDSIFFTGLKPSKQVISLSKSFTDLTYDLENTKIAFENLKDSADFGEIFDPVKFRKSELQSFIDGFNKKLLETEVAIQKSEDKLATYEEIARRIGAIDLIDAGEFEAAGDAAEVLGKRLSGAEIDRFKSNFRNLIKDIAPEISAELLESENPFANFLEQIKKTKNELEDLRLLQSQREDDKRLKEATKELENIIDLDEYRFLLSSKLDVLYKSQIGDLESQSKIFSAFKDSSDAFYQSERKRIELERKYAKQKADTLYADDRKVALLKAEEQYLKDITGLLQDERNEKISQVLDSAVENSKVLKESLSDALSNIPSNILDFAEQRRDLSRQLRKAEFDLREARAEGDRESIANAEYRVELVKYEMDQYKRGLSEIREIFLDIFDSISQTYFEQLSERVAQGLSDIQFGDMSLGKQLGNALDKTTGLFLANFRDTVTLINNEYFENLKSVLLEHVENLRRIQFGEESLPEEQSFSEEMTEAAHGINETNNKLDKIYAANADQLKQDLKSTSMLQKTFQATGSLIASSVATSIVGTGGRGSNIGSQFGSMIGGSVTSPNKKGEIFGRGFGSLLGTMIPIAGTFVGGLLGGWIGGLFDKDEPPEEPLLSKAMLDNTEATINNTIALKELDGAIFNAPTRYNVPAASGSFGASVVININGSNSPEATARQVRQEIENVFNRESRVSGSRGYARF